jgi:hypothetical protein
MQQIFQSGGELPSRLQPLPSATAPWLAIQSVQFSGVVHYLSTADACIPSLRNMLFAHISCRGVSRV